MAGNAEGLTVRLSMNEAVSDLAQRLINPDAVVELVLRNCVVNEQEELLAQIGRCVELRRLRCAACALAPSQLFQVTMERLPNLEDLELSLLEPYPATAHDEIDNVRRIASRRAAIIRSRSRLCRLYVEVGHDHNFKLLRELLGFYPSLTDLHVHVVRGGTFSNAVFQCLRLHNELVKLECFTFTSELPVPITYVPDLSSKFNVLAAACANVRHAKCCDSWSSFELRHLASRDRVVTLPPQLAVVAVMNDETEEAFRAASRRHLWTHVRELSLLLLPPMHSGPFYTAVHGAYRDCLRDFFSVALVQVVELNLSSFHFRPDLDLMELLRQATLNRLQGFSVPPCAFRRQSAVHRLAASCPNLRDLDVRLERLEGHFRCDSCEFLLDSEVSVQSPLYPATPYFRHKCVARLTLSGVPCNVLLWFIECYGAAVTLRLADWQFFNSLQYGRLCCLLGENSAIRCLVIQHDRLPIDDKRLLVSLSRMTSLRHLCLLTWMLVSNSIVVSFVRQIIARAAQLECVHIHCVPPDDRREQRVSWLRGRQREVRFQESPCFACCSTATFIGLVKPVNRDCESVLVE